MWYNNTNTLFPPPFARPGDPGSHDAKGASLNPKLRRSSFAEGALIAYIAAFASKALGALYSIPFYAIIGDTGGFLYTCAYNVYALFYDISTSGIPIAISILIAEYASTGQYASKEKTYVLGRRLVLTLSICAFLFLQLTAEVFARYYLSGMHEGATVESVASAIRAVSFCLLPIPFLSTLRGYLQGHKVIAAPSTSQVIEQFVRIVTAVGGSYLIIHLLRGSVSLGVNVALLGTACGALAALLYLLLRSRKSRDLFPMPAPGETADSGRVIYKKLLGYCLTLVLASVAISLYNIIDMRLILHGLTRLRFPNQDTQTISAIASNWAPKICSLITALAIGMTNSIAPHIADDFAKKDHKGISSKFNQSLSIILLIGMPLAVGVAVFSDMVYAIFYGPSDAGSYILKLAVFMNVIGSMVTVLSMGMQSMKKGPLVCIAVVAGIVLNTALDLPLIYAFHELHLPPYLGATFSSLLGQSCSLAILIFHLKKQNGFSFRPALTTFFRLLLPLAALTLLLLFLRRVLLPAHGRLLMTGQFALLTLAGMAVYLPLAALTRALDPLLNEGFMKKIVQKLFPGRPPR